MRLPSVTSVILAPVLLAACVGSQTDGVRNGPQSVAPTGAVFVPVQGTVVAAQKSQIAPKASTLSQKAVATQAGSGISPHVAESMQIFRTTCMAHPNSVQMAETAMYNSGRFTRPTVSEFDYTSGHYAFFRSPDKLLGASVTWGAIAGEKCSATAWKVPNNREQALAVAQLFAASASAPISKTNPSFTYRDGTYVVPQAGYLIEVGAAGRKLLHINMKAR